ncbi:zinc ribbon domain-containing protein [Methanococcoides sp. FTZ1]|uniref:zinc ribbon domain-containing protein n=1 Tax=Methanococcoides sp. FTZ1 TaxID=3439061 RepID=UPI003F845CFF
MERTRKLFTPRTKKIVDYIEANYQFGENEFIIDAVSGIIGGGVVMIPFYSTFGMDGENLHRTIRKMGFVLTQDNIIVHYLDKDESPQLAVNPIETIENVVYAVEGMIFKNDVLSFYKDGHKLGLIVTKNELADKFLENALECIEYHQYGHTNEIVDNGNTSVSLYCTQCGVKLPSDAIFCMKCGTKVVAENL